MGDNPSGRPHEPAWRRGIESARAAHRCGARTQAPIEQVALGPAPVAILPIQAAAPRSFRETLSRSRVIVREAYRGLDPKPNCTRRPPPARRRCALVRLAAAQHPEQPGGQAISLRHRRRKDRSDYRTDLASSSVPPAPAGASAASLHPLLIAALPWPRSYPIRAGRARCSGYDRYHRPVVFWSIRVGSLALKGLSLVSGRGARGAGGSRSFAHRARVDRSSHSPTISMAPSWLPRANKLMPQAEKAE